MSVILNFIRSVHVSSPSTQGYDPPHSVDCFIPRYRACLWHLFDVFWCCQVTTFNVFDLYHQSSVVYSHCEGSGRMLGE